MFFHELGAIEPKPIDGPQGPRKGAKSMLQDAELDAKVREAQRVVAAMMYEAARSAPYSVLSLEIHVENGKPVRRIVAIRRSERFNGPAEGPPIAPSRG